VELTGARVLAYMVHAGANWPQPWGYRPDLRPFRVLPPSAEIRSVVANRIQDGAAVTATLAWRPSPSVTYRLQMVSPVPTTALCEPLFEEQRSRVKELIYDTTPSGGWRRPWEAAFLIPLHDLESLGAKALIEVVTLRRGSVVDRSGWIPLCM
jgi:hypothetical protein